MTALDTAFLAARLAVGSVSLLLVPGLLFVAWMGIRARWEQSVVLAFAVSYSWVFVLSIAVPLFHWTVQYASIATIALVAVLIIAAMRTGMQRRGMRDAAERTDLLIVAALAIGGAVAGWVIEPPFTGEEALDFAAISRFADGGPITLWNASLVPDSVPVYLFQPYQLCVALIAAWSGIDPLVAYIKLRAVLAPLTIVFVYSLIRHLSPSRIEARAAFMVVMLFAATDIETWQMNSLFPLVRRGGFGAGICVPVLMTLCFMATRKANDEEARRAGRVALGLASVMLAASLSTHPLEMFPFLWFAAGVVLTVLAGIDRVGERRQAALLALLLTLTTGGYLTLHSRLAPYVAEYERADKAGVRARLAELMGTPLQAIAGEPTEARDILTRTIPATTAVVIGIPAMAVAALRSPAAASVLALGIVPLALLYATPAGYMALALLTSVETVRDVNAYFCWLGIIALAVGLTSLAQIALQAASWRQNGLRHLVAISAAGSVVVWGVWIWGINLVRSLADAATAQPELLLLVGAAAMVVAIAIAIWNRTIVPLTSMPTAAVLATLALAAPLAAPEWAFGGVFAKRDAVTLPARFEQALASASVLEWPAYYETLKGSIAPRLPVPRAVVDELRRRIPARQVVLADPRYSCALVVLIDAYCINPERIYGHYFQPAARYHTDFVRVRENSAPEHPFYNPLATLSAEERRLLQQYRVSYVLADPNYANAIAAKMRELAGDARLEMDLDGYRLYRIGV